MNATDLYKVASFMGRAHEALKPSDSGLGEAAGWGTAGGTIGALRGFARHATSEFSDIAANPAARDKYRTMLSGMGANPAKPGFRHALEALLTTLKQHPKRVALPTLGFGGAGALVGLLANRDNPSMKDRLERLKG